jgi:hypothetical protein
MEKKCDILLPPPLGPSSPIPQVRISFFKGFSCFAITEPKDEWSLLTLETEANGESRSTYTVIRFLEI